jgi:transposase
MRTVTQLNKQDDQIIHATCWAHTRLKFASALKMEPEAAQQGLIFIAKPYWVEKHIKAHQLNDGAP